MRNFILCFICSLFLCFSVVGCSNTIENIPAITAAGTTAYTDYDVVVGIIEENLDIFSPRELVQLKRANDRLLTVRTKINTLLSKKHGEVVELVTELPTLLPLYSEAKEAYLIAYNIIMSRIDEFSRQEQIILYNYQATCERLDNTITESLTSEDGTDNTQMVKDIVSFVLLVGKVILPLLVV